MSSCGVRVPRRPPPPQARAPAAPCGRACRWGSAEAAPEPRSRGDHVVGKAATQMLPHAEASALDRRPQPIGHKPLVARGVLPRDHRRLRHAPVPHQRRLDLAWLDREAAHLHWLSARPRKSKTPSARQRARSPLRYIRLPAGPNGSATNRSAVSPARPRYPRASPAPLCKAPPPPRPVLAPIPRPIHIPGNRAADDPSGCAGQLGCP